MPYIGNTSPSRFVSNRAASVYSGDGSTTAFTLEQAVVQDEDILVSVDGVVQEPSVAYAVSNATTLTFTGAPSSNAGNNIFVYYLASQVGTAGPPNDSVSTTTLKNSAVTNAKVANSTLDLTSKVTGVLPVGNSQTNTPAFQARRSTGFQFSDNTDTKVTGFAEDFDTDNNFASDRFTPTTAGKYFVTIQGSIQGVSNYDMYNANINLRKNGTELLKTSSQGNASSRSNRYGLSLSLIVDMNGSSDYLEMYVYLNNVGSNDGIFNADTLSFGAFKLIGA